MDYFSSSTIANNFCNLNDANAVRTFYDFNAKCHPSRASKCECQLLLYNLHSSEIFQRIKRWLEFVILNSRNIFLMWGKLEDC